MGLLFEIQGATTVGSAISIPKNGEKLHQVRLVRLNRDLSERFIRFPQIASKIHKISPEFTQNRMTMIHYDKTKTTRPGFDEVRSFRNSKSEMSRSRSERRDSQVHPFDSQ